VEILAAFRGQPLIAIWNDIVAEGRTDFIEWHNREHIFERLSFPGFCPAIATAQ
jgi:hypothetical protein